MRSRSARLEMRLEAPLRWLRREREEADAEGSHSTALAMIAFDWIATGAPKSSSPESSRRYWAGKSGERGLLRWRFAPECPSATVATMDGRCSFPRWHAGTR